MDEVYCGAFIKISIGNKKKNLTSYNKIYTYNNIISNTVSNSYFGLVCVLFTLGLTTLSPLGSSIVMLTR